MEKYLDPNRPFKCDVCKESFTQKNILLVHYNSVSHLNRLKKSLNNEQSSKETAEKQTSENKTPTRGSALEALLGNIRGDKKDDDEVKAFKCNICKVAYSQGSTLDIHIRSVLHQTKASKLQELIMSGQIDMSKPLIEQPDATQLQEQHKKMLNDMLSPKSLNSTGSSNPQTSPNVRNSSSPSRSSPHSSPLATMIKGESTSSPGTGQQSSGAGQSTYSPDQPKHQQDKSASPVLKNLLQMMGKDASADLDMVKNLPNGTDEPATSLVNGGSEEPKPKGVAEVQDALKAAMMNAQLQQMNPLMMQMAQLQGMNPLLAMNLHPPLIPPNMMNQKAPPADNPANFLAQLQNAQQIMGGQMPALPGFPDPKLLALMQATRQDAPEQPTGLAQMMGLLNKTMPPLDTKLLPPSPVKEPKGSPLPSKPEQLPIIPQPPMPTPPQPQEQGKRARTRITDEQLKILRSHFDINNSPAEDTLNKMAAQTGLPLKVIKHWFRNTLFKERQKNKDSPYNFNNAPTTKLNLEEYEKTGEPKVTSLAGNISAEPPAKEIKLDLHNGGADSPKKSAEALLANAMKIPTILTDDKQQPAFNLSRLLSMGGAPPLLPNFPAFPNLPNTTSASAAPPPIPEFLNNIGKQQSAQAQQQRQQQQTPPPRPISPSSVNSSGKRANRTRFTDYQIKVLQEFFENNAYPKDDDLEYLSKLLGLSPRVIVVWFQNARQKARKVYENQPANEAPAGAEDEAAGRFTRTSSCNYQCKKCLLVFQRYYELIRHQKQHCYKEEDAKKSAQAQKAAAQAAAQFGGSLNPYSDDSNGGGLNDDRGSMASPASTPAPDERHSTEEHSFRGPEMEGALNKFMQQQQNPILGLLQQQASLNQRRPMSDHGSEAGDQNDSVSGTSSPNNKRKFSEDVEDDEASLLHKEKRLRTSILPEQLDFLYQRYQQENSPTPIQLEDIAGEVGLNKAVVEMWFQNTRARERKGLMNNGNHLTGGALNNHPPPPPPPMAAPEHDDIAADSQDNNGPVHRVPQPPFALSEQLASLMPNASLELQSSMRKYYEDTMRRFMNDVQGDRQGKDAPLDMSGGHEAMDQENFEDSDHNKSLDGNDNGACGNKRFRTQMSGTQVKMMKAVFEVYKTPTMTECSNLGRDIGLQKRVVQVWFQNARAKEKRAKLQLQQATGKEPENPPLPVHCPVCPGFVYPANGSVQDHIFSKEHLDNLRVALESGRYEPEAPGQAMSQAAAAIQGNTVNGSPPPLPATSNGSAEGASLSLMKMPDPATAAGVGDLIERQNPRMLMQV